MNEADTCRKFVVPKLQAVGWDDEPHSIAEQRYFTDGRIVVRSGQAVRRPGKKADYLLRHTRDFPIGVVEAKAECQLDSNCRTTNLEIETAEERGDNEDELKENSLSASNGDRDGVRCRKYYLDEGQVEIAAELDADGKQLRLVKLTDYTEEKVHTLFARPEDLHARWADAGRRADIIQQLASPRGISALSDEPAVARPRRAAD